MSTKRGIDHLVVAVEDLGAARERYSGLGFITTPLGRQPWGTANHLVQFPRNFIELVGVLDASAIVPMSAEHFSFSAGVVEGLRRREGMCMLVLTTEDARADADEWRSRGLHVYEPFHWSRGATLPDGSETTVAFTLTFVTDPAMPEMAFFSCQQHNPEMFWKPEYQAHANGARAVSGVTVVAADPTRHAAFVAEILGDARIIEASDGVRIEAANGAIRIQSPAGFAARFPGATGAPNGGSPAFAAATVDVDDPDAVAEHLGRSAIPFSRRDDAVWVDRNEACGILVEFVPG